MKQAPSFSDRRSQHRERFAGAVLAILVQAGFLALLVVSRPMMAPPEKGNKELTLFLPRLMPAPASKPSLARRAPFFAPAPIVPLPPTANAPLAAPLPQMRAVPAAPDLSGIGRALQDCNIDNYANLGSEQRKLCPRPGEGYAVLEAPDLMHPPNSHVEDQAHWQEEFAREKANLMVPCTGVMSVGGAAVPAISPLCILAMLATGHGDELVDPHKWPHAQIEQMSAPDFAKIEKAYDAWNKEHANPPPSSESVGVHPQ